MFHNRRLLAASIRPPFVASAAASVWGDHGTNITLSQTTIANDTAAGTAGSFSSVRGTQAHSSGKFYFEIKIVTAGSVEGLSIGLMDDATATGAAMDGNFGAFVNTGGNFQFNGDHQGNGGGFNGTNFGAHWALANNDVMGLAADFTNGFWYLHLNNVYFLSGDPTSGGSGTGAAGNGGMANAFPALNLLGPGASSSIVQLITGASAIASGGRLPAGYTAWG